MRCGKGTRPYDQWTNSVRNAFRKQAGWAKVQKVRATAVTHWTARVWYRHNQRWLQASKEGAEASKSGSFKDGREWGKKCFEDLDQRRMGRQATSTWSTDFLLREGSNREEIGKWLKNKSIPWQQRRRLLQVVTGTFPWTAAGEIWLQGKSRVYICLVPRSQPLERRPAALAARPRGPGG